MKNFGRWAAIPIRLIVGYGFVAHGYAKMARGPDAVCRPSCMRLSVPAPR